MAAELNWTVLVALAIVQGVTEFLPISSSAHLLLPSQLFGIPDQGLMFDTSVHGGTLVAVIIYFRHELMGKLQACLYWRAETKQDRIFVCWLLLASLPVLTIGFLLVDFIPYLRNLWVVSLTTILFALLLWWAARRTTYGTETSWRIIAWVGLAQVLALVPGVSRAGITMTAGLWQGLSPVAASRLAFLFSIPVIAAACGFGIYRLILLGDQQQLFAALVAFFLAALFAYLTISFFLRLVDKIGMMPFIIYRLVLGTVLLGFLFINHGSFPL